MFYIFFQVEKADYFPRDIENDGKHDCNIYREKKEYIQLFAEFFLELCAFMIKVVSSIEQKKSKLRYSDVVLTALSGV